MFYSVLLLPFVLSVVSARTLWHQLSGYTFDDYTKEFSKKYEGEEFLARKQLFSHKLSEIMKHNSDHTKSWKMGVNKFTDRTTEELGSTHGLNRQQVYQMKREQSNEVRQPSIPQGELPVTFDWRNKGVVTATKDQGHCGSCWAFATTEVFESFLAIKTGQLYEMTPQQLVSCMPNPDSCGGTGGCAGATVELGLDYISTYGLASAWQWPYETPVYYNSYTGDEGECLAGKTFGSSPSNQQLIAPPVAYCTGYEYLPANDYSSLLNAIATQGPIAVSVDASTWHSYESGVYDGCDYSAPVINHAVVLVGYGDGFWIVRNSWGADWGQDSGYIYLKRHHLDEVRGDLPVCGIDPDPSSGVACEDEYNETVTVCGTCGILFDSCYPVGVELA